MYFTLIAFFSLRQSLIVQFLAIRKADAASWYFYNYGLGVVDGKSYYQCSKRGTNDAFLNRTMNMQNETQHAN